MARSLAVLNHPEFAAAVDEREERARAARRAAADDLHRRSAPYELVMNEHAAAPPAPRELGPLPLSVRAYAILGLVESYIGRGFAGVELGAADIVRLFRRSPRDGWCLRNVWIALASLRRSGYLQRVTRTVPVEQTKLGKAYVSMTIAGRRELARRQGRRGRKLPPRCLHSDAPDAYARSQVRNLWTLGTNARAAKLGKRCGQLREQLALTANCTATVLPQSSEASGSDGSIALSVVGPVTLWTTAGGGDVATPSASERESPTRPPSPIPPASGAESATATPEADEGSGHASAPRTVGGWISSLWRRFRRSDGPC